MSDRRDGRAGPFVRFLFSVLGSDGSDGSDLLFIYF